MKLLIIDDEPHIRHMMRLTLESAGYQVDEAADGQAGLDCFQADGGYDAVVLDQKMPGLDGLDTLRRIKERNPHARVLMATAFGSIELAVDAMRLGASDFLRKPMTPETLRGAVAAAVAGASSRVPPRSSPAARAREPLDIAVLTMNGFQIRRGPAAAPGSSTHVFVVTHVADHAAVTVTVTIDSEAVARVDRLTHRHLDAGGPFWRLQAERLLSAFVWSEGRVPGDGGLTVRDVSRDDLDVAARWEDT